MPRLPGKLKWLILGTLSAAGGGWLVLKVEVENLRKNLHPPMNVLEREKFKSYIYIRPSQMEMLRHHWDEDGLKHVSTEIHKYVVNHIPQNIAKHLPRRFFSERHLTEQHYLSPWQLLKEASSTNPDIPEDVTHKISNHDWHDQNADPEGVFSAHEYRLLAQNLNPSYLYALARIKDVDQRFFVRPRLEWEMGKESAIEYKLYDILTKLPMHDVESCLRFFTHGALSISDERQLKMGGRWCFGGNGLNYTREIVPQEKVESFCLQALVKHSKIPNHCESMVKLGVLELLQQIHHRRPSALKVQRNTVRLISNLCVNENLHPHILKSGWLSYLVEISKSDHLPLRIQASRGLANLDRKNVKEKYLDGVYLIHPRHRTEEKPAADIVLIHGLLGGAFYSWRQQESDSIAVDADNFTQCWPETWLPKDLPNVRVVCVEYDTHLSDWMPHCPHEKQTRTISHRSQEILDKLKTAGVGERPVVWVAHSMGGLVLKNMLTISSEDTGGDYEGVLKNTRGIIFYSTPHFGSQLADYSRKVRRLLFPSVEVMALSHDSPQLLHLNDSFRRIVQERDLKILSFGERQPTNIGFGKLKIQIVSPKSADPGVGSVILCDSDHLNICKPVSRHSAIYHNTVEFIRACLEDSDSAGGDLKLGEVIDEIFETFT